jgi:hypothetical protein
MVICKSFRPFFSEVENEINYIGDNHELAKNELIARDPVFYQKTMFRAFLHLSKKETEKMNIQTYIDYHIMFKEYLKIFHAPYIDKE